MTPYEGWSINLDTLFLDHHKPGIYSEIFRCTHAIFQVTDRLLCRLPMFKEPEAEPPANITAARVRPQATFDRSTHPQLRGPIALVQAHRTQGSPRQVWPGRDNMQDTLMFLGTWAGAEPVQDTDKAYGTPDTSDEEEIILAA
jgi:hypothetical protein